VVEDLRLVASLFTGEDAPTGCLAAVNTGGSWVAPDDSLVVEVPLCVRGPVIANLLREGFSVRTDPQDLGA
jgi:hypothetical protein